ncbi:MAG: hypothetical protein L3V56_12145 [Candidatus Magnetoovum sp. WYHC-5]|nr:hypothetical protein [Candidatus Magnetoovum sp. WYHC-5]
MFRQISIGNTVTLYISGTPFKTRAIVEDNLNIIDATIKDNKVDYTNTIKYLNT